MMWTPDGEGRVNTVSASSGQNPVSGTTYNAAGLPTAINLGSGSGDADAYQWDPNTNRMTQYTYAEASENQQMVAWIGAHVRTFEFLGGCPQLVVPDNTKTGVAKPCRYEPDLNPTYQEMAAHYGVGVLPARPREPRDKAKVEAGVQILSIGIAAPNLPTNLTAREAHSVHVRIRRAVAEGAEKASEVMLIEGLIVGGCIQGNDVVCRRCAADRTRCGLRAIGFLRDAGNALWPTAEERHYRIIAAFQTKVNVSEYKGGPVRPDHVNVQFSVVPSSLNFARKVPCAPLAFGGTSLKVERFALKTTPWSSSAANAKLKAETSSATKKRFFMGISLRCRF